MSDLVDLDDESTDIIAIRLAEARKSDPPSKIPRDKVAELERKLLLRMTARHSRRILRLEVAFVVVTLTAALLEALAHAGVIHFGH